MSQETLTLSFSDEQLHGLNTVLTDIETRLDGLVALDAGQRRRLMKMGRKSETFCRQAMVLLGQNPQLVAPGLNFPSAQTNLASLDQLRPFLLRVKRLAERLEDTEMALGSTVMNTALKGYAQLKLLGRNQGLDSHRDALRARFARAPARPAQAEQTQAA